MRYINITKPGPAEVLQLAETAIPVPGPGQVLIRVAAAGVNRLDILQRQGFYPAPPGASVIPGVEVAGEIVTVAERSGQLKPGDHVCALLSGGGYAEYTVADAAICLPIPAGIDSVDAGAIPEAFFTVWNNVFDLGHLQAGDNFLVHGGSSGIGSTAIQLARAFGSRVFATAGNDEKCHFCEALGADLAINYHTRDYVSECLSATDQRGIDLTLDMVGGDYLDKNIEIAAEEGRIVIISAFNGYRSTVDLLPVLRKRLIITGSTLRSRPIAFKQAIADKLIRHIWPLLESRQVKPVIYRTFPLEQAAAAHRLLEAGEHMGKIVLTVNV